MSTIDRIKIRNSALTGTIYACRTDKKGEFALDKKDVTSDVFASVIESLLGAELKGGVSQTMRYGDKAFKVTVERITNEEFEAERKEDGNE